MTARRPLFALLVACLLAGCPAGTGTKVPATGGDADGPRKATPKPSASASLQPTTGPEGVKPLALPPGMATRAIAANAGSVVSLTGKVKLLSDQGVGVISNNSGTLIANNGGGLIANNGGGVIANNGSSLISDKGAAFTLKQAVPAAEALLADAQIYVTDAAGRALTDAAGKPIMARTDASGAYRLDATLPAEGVLLKIRLWNGGELTAMLPRGAKGDQPIDTASSLGAAYVLGEYILTQPDPQSTFDKLPEAEAARLRRELDAARVFLDALPTYEPGKLQALTATLRTKAPAVDQALTEIKALLVGQANLGSGKRATDVPLADPRATAAAPGGGFYISEGTLGRIRRVAPDGTLTTYVDQLLGEVKENLYGLVDMIAMPDGGLLMATAVPLGVTRLSPDGQLTRLAGIDNFGIGPLGGLATASAIQPWSVALGPDGLVWIGEFGTDTAAGRVLIIGKDGILRESAPAHPSWKKAHLCGLVVKADGTAWALAAHGNSPDGNLYKLAPGGSWTLIGPTFKITKQGDLALDTAGNLFLSEDDAGKVHQIAPDGTPTTLMDVAKGSGVTRPTKLQTLPNGGLRIVDGAGIRVVERAADGTITNVAGKLRGAGEQQGEEIAVNGPFSAVDDGQGGLFISETANHVISRWDGKSLTPYIGSLRGDSGDGPRGTTLLDTPSGLAFAKGELFIMEQGQQRIRRVSAEGTVTLAYGGSGQPRMVAGELVAPNRLKIEDGVGLAVGPDGSLYSTSLGENLVYRQAVRGGLVSLLAGGGGKGDAGDDGPAASCQLNTPFSVAVGPDGALYLSEPGNGRIRRISDPSGANPLITTYAGAGGITGLFAIEAAPPAGTPALETPLAFPSGIAFGPDGTMYVAEFGTLSIKLLRGLAAGLRDLPVDALPKLPARVRKITKDGKVTVIAGPGGKFFQNPEAGDALVLPTGITVDDQGRLVIVDAGANLVRILPAGSY